VILLLTHTAVYSATPGFSNMYKSRNGAGARFVDLLQEVAAVNPEMRIRFTSPHPKVCYTNHHFQITL
jgi:tRNA A37 methylthiotransferase MiaB